MTSKNHKQQPTTPAKLERLEGRLEVLFPTSEPDAYARIYREMGDRAEKENWSYRDFLALLLGPKKWRAASVAALRLYSPQGGARFIFSINEP